MTFLKNFINDEEGQDLVEYALLIGFIAIAAIGVVTAFGTTIKNKFTNMGDALGT